MQTSTEEARNAAFAALYAKRPQTIKPGLARIEAALAALDGEALLATPTVLVAGTNGKGTTTGYLWQLLSALGVRTGLFTSPHLVHFAERIQVSHERIDDALLLRELAELERTLPPELYEPLSFFEVNTLLALRLFRRLGSELNLLEVGLGGRWDSTNVARPCLTIITSIGLDHQQWLGSTTAAIAGEKAGIMRPGSPVIWGGPRAGDAAATAVLRARAAALQAPFWELDRDFGDEPGGKQFFIELPLPGLRRQTFAWPPALRDAPPYLRDNFLKAAAACLWLLQAKETAAPRARLSLMSGAGDALARAIDAFQTSARTPPPCMRARFETVAVAARGEAPAASLLLDVCHNPDGARALVAALQATNHGGRGAPLPAMISILADKEYDEILDILRPHLAQVYLFGVLSERAWSRAHLAPRHQDLPFFASFAAAWRAAPQPLGLTLVCGSVHAVGDVCAHLGIATLG